MKNVPTVVPVVAAALINGVGQVLLQQRSPGRSHAGLWEFPGGKAEPGESLDAALFREIEEELAIRIDLAAIEPLSFSTTPGQAYVVLLYTCPVWSGDPQPLDAQALGWYSAEELPGLALLPLDIPLARSLIAYLKSDK